MTTTPHRLAVLTFSVLLVAGTVRAENWPRWRGPTGQGDSTEKVPTEWSPGAVVWKADLQGVGQSSPIIWQDRIFLTTSVGSDGKVERFVICLDRKTGKPVWQQLAITDAKEKLHQMNTPATASCVTDGEVVAAFFGDGGLHCYTLDGKKLWDKDLGKFPNSWGTAASPIIVGKLVIQNCDSTGKSSLIAFDKQTGQQVWKTPRRDTPKGGWSTPIVIDTGKRKELVLNGEFGVQAYNPESGEDYWYCKSFNGRGSPTPVFGHGLVYVINGKPGDIYAVRPGGSGDVTNSQMAWHTARGGDRDLPSPALVDRFLFTVSMKGICTCYDAPTGKLLFKERLPGNFSSSPIVAGGLIYQQTEAGDTYVIRPGNALDIVATNTLGATGDEIFRASPAACDGKLFFRSNKRVYCVGGKSAE